MKTQKTVANIIVVGAGFAGVAVVKTLLKTHVNAKITVVTDKDYMTYYPSLYGLVTDANQSEAAFPLTSIFPERVHILRATFSRVDHERRVVIALHKGVETLLPYDYVVVALGSEVNYFNIPGLKERSFSFKSVDSALALKAHFESVLASAKTLEKNDAVARLHTLVVGGGPSGLEVAATLKHYLVKRAKIHGIDSSLVTIDLIEASSRLLPTMSEKISRIAEARIRTLGVNVFTNRALQSEDIDEVVLNDMEVKTGTVIWTAGTSINNEYSTISGVTLSERKRVVVTDYLTLPTDDRVFIAGDGAATEYSGLAQTAIHNGKYIGKTITRMIRGKNLTPYKPHVPTFVIPIGKNWALFSHQSMLWCGVLPSILRRLIDWQYKWSITK
ncbi:FAD-dependent oxidoreductase [Patescibacteria group bacterium]|nr:FAD-dependent oxidoreductase [Patescibacteria group bacterium]